jgi:hypothetical protein
MTSPVVSLSQESEEFSTEGDGKNGSRYSLRPRIDNSQKEEDGIEGGLAKDNEQFPSIGRKAYLT